MLRKSILSLLNMQPKNGDKLPPPTFRVVLPDETLPQEIWFKMFHVSARWAKDYHHRESVIAYHDYTKKEQ